VDSPALAAAPSPSTRYAPSEALGNVLLLTNGRETYAHFERADVAPSLVRVAMTVTDERPTLELSGAWRYRFSPSRAVSKENRESRSTRRHG
jgi:hypothetical protein